MAIYYVSKSGDDANNGLGPNAAHASNKPWLTIGKALGASGIASGDTVYIGPGVYREQVTIAMTSATAETSVLGDPRNRQGFKDGSAVLVPPGEVRWTAFDDADDKTLPSGSSPLITFAGRDYLTFRYMTLCGGKSTTAQLINAASESHNITFTDCKIIHGTDPVRNAIVVTAAFATALNWLFDRCVFLASSAYWFNLTLTRGTGDDYDANFVIQNSLAAGAATGFCNVVSTGAGANFGGGVIVRNNTILLPYTIFCGDANLSTTYPCKLEGNLIFTPGYACRAASLTSPAYLTEDYNIFNGAARLNVDAGANTIVNTYADLVHLGESAWNGGMPRPFFMPTADSPFLGFGDAGDAPAYDFLNRIRPGGGAITKAVGALERHDVATKETSVVDAADASIKLTGPSDQDIYVPVNAESTTISIKARYDSGTYGGTNYPQAILLDASEIGVATETETATVSASDAWETLTFSAITPTAKGVVRIRLVNRSTAAAGICYFDTLGIA